MQTNQNQYHYSGTSLIQTAWDQSLFRLVQTISETIHSNEGAISVLYIAYQNIIEMSVQNNEGSD